ncbi:MAG: DUF4870 domain-containing protein [Halobacteriota archaeon]
MTGEHPADDRGESGLGTGGHPEVAGGLEEHIAGALTYLLGFVTGLLFLVVEEENEFVRFHAAQSSLLFGGLFLLAFGLSIIMPMFAIVPVFGWVFVVLMSLFWSVTGVVVLMLWLVLMYKAYSGERYALPVVGPIADKYV